MAKLHWLLIPVFLAGCGSPRCSSNCSITRLPAPRVISVTLPPLPDEPSAVMRFAAPPLPEDLEDDGPERVPFILCPNTNGIPFRAYDAFGLLSWVVASPPQVARITFDTVPGQTYRLLYHEELGQSARYESNSLGQRIGAYGHDFITVMTNRVATSNSITFEIGVLPLPSSFYKVIQMP